MKNIIILCLSCLILFGCRHSEKPEQKFRSLKILQGEWESNNNMIYFENWKIYNDTMLIGKGFSLRDQDTLFSESLSIILINDSIFYRAQVRNQNQGKSIPFLLTESSKKSFVFENPEHDYPQRIIYQIVNDNILKVRIETMKETKVTHFNLKRKLI